MMAKSSESFPARTRLYSAGTTRRLVRSPPAPKIVRVAGGARWPDRLFATASAASATMVVTAGAPGGASRSVVLKHEGRACLLAPYWLFSLSSASRLCRDPCVEEYLRQASPGLWAGTARQGDQCLSAP